MEQELTRLQKILLERYGTLDLSEIVAPEPDPECPNCTHGQRFFRDVKTGKQWSVPCDCEAGQVFAEKEVKRLTNLVDLPEELAGIQLSDFTDLGEDHAGKRNAIAAAELMASHRGTPFTLAKIYRRAQNPRRADDNFAAGGVVLYSPEYGLGKTALAAAVANAFISASRSVLFIRVSSMLEEIKTTRFKNDTETAYTETKICRYGLVVFDEWSMPSISEADKTHLERLYGARHNAGLPVIVTTNETPASFKAKYGAYIASRLAKDCHWVQMGGRPLRKSQNNHDEAVF